MLRNEKYQVSLRLSTSLVAEFDRIAATENLRDAQGLDKLDRGESVDLEDVLEKARQS